MDIAGTRPCPRPNKLRFAAREAAEVRARIYTDIYGTKQYVYGPCRCGYYHLTTRKPR